MTRKPFMQELVTHEQLLAGEIRPTVAFTLGRPALANLVYKEMEKFAGYGVEQEDRLLILKSNGLEVVELSRTLEPYPRQRQYVLSLATEDRNFNYHSSPTSRVVVRAEQHVHPEQRSAIVAGFVTTGEVLSLGAYVSQMEVMELPEYLQSDAADPA
jgi:hypothetical protein